MRIVVVWPAVDTSVGEMLLLVRFGFLVRVRVKVKVRVQMSRIIIGIIRDFPHVCLMMPVARLIPTR